MSAQDLPLAERIGLHALSVRNQGRRVRVAKVHPAAFMAMLASFGMERFRPSMEVAGPAGVVVAVPFFSVSKEVEVEYVDDSDSTLAIVLERYW